jgi:OOP family OmpA-OmpF porin
MQSKHPTPMQTKRTIAAAVVLAFGLSPVLGHASSPSGPGEWYLGMTFGSSNVGDTPDVVPLAGSPPSVVFSDERDPGVKALAGYRFGRNFAIEGGYAWLGEFQVSNQASAPAAGAVTADMRVIGLFVDAVGLLPVGWGFTALAKVGVVGSEVRTTRTVTGQVAPAPGLGTTSSADEANLKYGLGLQYELGARVAVRAEWERFVGLGSAQTGEVDLDVYSIGVMLRFR